MNVVSYFKERSAPFTARNVIRNRQFVSAAPALVRGLVAPSRRILCTKHSLRHPMLLARIFAQNGYRTVLHRAEPHAFSVHMPSNTAEFVVNGRHVDNQKARVARLWQKASGRALEVDPTAHEGPMVEKSDDNATHDGRVLHGPVTAAEIAPGKVYQRLIDNSRGDEVVDLRVAFHGPEIPLVYVKRRPISSRFSNDNSGVEIAETDALFDAAEQRTLLDFAGRAGLDFGEADVLRDRRTGEIWVVDSTNGPAGPPNGLPHAEKRRAVRRLAAAFDRMLEHGRAAA